MSGEADGEGGGGGGQRLRRLILLPPGRGAPPPDQERPLLVSTPPLRKGGFASAALLRGLGCTSAAAAQAYAPSSAAAAVVRSSADWQVKRSSGGRRRKGKALWKKERDGHQRHPPPSPLHPRRSAVGADLWCAPGIAFSASAEDSVDCVVPHHPRLWPPPEGRGVRAADGERVLRERSCMARRGGRRLEQLSSVLDSPPHSAPEEPLAGSDLIWPGHRRRIPSYHISPGGLEEVVMLQSRVLLGGMDAQDRYWDWRLDVDNMSYEQLLELGDKIGYVDTGLREEEIFQCLRRTKHSIFGVSPREFSIEMSPREYSIEMERKCSICQEEYEVNDELGKLECGHCYHLHCIRQWLLQKNACPVCKTAAAKS